jgi:peptidoglycan/xylan/chitin deacetylase (PgdA/CDA1 family)
MTALSRRTLLAAGGAALVSPTSAQPAQPALIALTLDLEMSRNFPTWEQVHWDYEKGNLDAATRRYAVEACRRVRARGGVVHCFAVGRALEQEDVEWLAGIARAGHPVGNHTYDHVNVTAARPEDIQFRFRRAPWLIEGKAPAEVIRENIRLTNAALKSRLGITAAGFRTPGGFAKGLDSHPEVRKMLRGLGFRWVSSRYPAHPLGQPEREPTAAVLEGIVRAAREAQPFTYPDGLVEVPMSPVSDINAFRNGRWKLEWFLTAIRRAVEDTIARGAVFDFLAHPSCLGVMDPDFRTVDLICDLVARSGGRGKLVGLDELAARAAPAPAGALRDE